MDLFISIYIYIYIYIVKIKYCSFFHHEYRRGFWVIIIIMSCRLHGSSWPSPGTHLYRPLLPVSLRGYIQYQHRAVVYRFLPVVLPLLIHVKGYHEYVTYGFVLTSQQCPACLVRLTWIVFVMGGKWPCNFYFVGYYLQDLFNIARSILV